MNLLKLFLHISGTVLAQEMFHFECLRNTEAYMAFSNMKRETCLATDHFCRNCAMGSYGTYLVCLSKSILD